MDDLIRPDIRTYAERHSSREPDELRLIREETERSVPGHQMISGHLQGRLLAAISRMLRPRLVLEIGTFTGYSALCLAEGLSPGGRVVTLERDLRLEPLIRRNLSLSTLGSSVTLVMCDAHYWLQTSTDRPDLVFLDADKKGYSAYYERLVPMMAAGACMLVDNVLWRGQVVEPEPDAKTQSVMAFNEQVRDDDRVECVMLPFRDGLTLIRKR